MAHSQSGKSSPSGWRMFLRPIGVSCDSGSDRLVRLVFKSPEVSHLESHEGDGGPQEKRRTRIEGCRIYISAGWWDPRGLPQRHGEMQTFCSRPGRHQARQGAKAQEARRRRIASETGATGPRAARVVYGIGLQTAGPRKPYETTQTKLKFS